MKDKKELKKANKNRTLSVLDVRYQKEKISVYNLDGPEDSPIRRKENEKKSLAGKIKFFILGKKKQFSETIRRKKQERLTLMFIPHNEKSIRHYHISNLNLTIILASFSLVIIISSILVIRHNSTIQEVDKLKVSHKDASKQFAKIRSEIYQIYSSFDDVRTNLVGLYSIIKGGEADSIFAKGGVSIDPAKIKASVENTEEKINQEKIPVEIYMLNRILDDIKIADKPLGEIKSFIQKRKRIIKNTPTLWPVTGYIVNSFGNKTNAITLRSETNPGIDIISFPGNPVVATAPGKVVLIKKDLRWNWTVKIKHKYGYYTVYKGLERVTIPEGENLAKGETLGYLGYTKESTENILRYEIYVGVEAVDPLPYINYIRE